MRIARSLALAACLVAAPTLSQAADLLFTPESLQTSGWIVTVKGNVRVGPSYPGSDEFSFIGYPSLSFRRAGTVERFSAPDDGLSFSFLDESVFRIGVVGRFQGGRYLQDNRELFGLQKVDWAVEPGVFVEYWPIDFLRARAEVRRGFNGHEGFVADFGLDAVQRFGAVTLSIGPRLALGDSEFTRTYFGVTPVEAALNGQVTPYRPSGGITSVGATGAISYDWSPQWSTTAFVTYKHLVGDAADSPIVKRFGSEHQVGFGLTVSYSFGYTP
ncbi:outer membrane scaffolding protein for murein synthesis (MipA/OmpV family) [Microvirga flocculans]|uniref:Outer membrane scaffolding protein for murein synthesis (MipA/OmpV family) n=1 Tax=Microvirga flocculans TaxID=217168 RepID=A0A7W6N6T1_9HYPH|nr:MipA/OmpV family protein [Microvirga flocculans]MBB4038745.1 outer membrane scaffolding protein for murein synthesis (MipA/OmpV family) [Microvirga flocculans]